jgi:hypothetical protein
MAIFEFEEILKEIKIRRPLFFILLFKKWGREFILRIEIGELK